ncbi:hypothetical protein JOD43_003825 [Pullulanibacillus pueri]|nr:hypothetical protein [Pullulanibacillus pueri]
MRSLTLSGITAKRTSAWSELQEKDINNQQKLLENEEVVNYFNSLHDTDWRKC